MPSAIAIIGAPQDLGQGRRGVDMGPSAMRVAGVGQKLAALGHKVVDLGNIEVAQAESEADCGPRESRFISQIAGSCERIAALVGKALRNGQIPLVLGGDHSVAAGTIAGVSNFYRQSGQKIGLVWIDAHADMNTPETSPSGNVHGMPLATVVGLGPEALTHMFGYTPKINPANVALVGLRDVDELERGNVSSTGVRAFTMRDIDERGMRAVISEAIEAASAGTAGFHLSLDMDFVDPEQAPGVGTPVSGGGTYRETHLAMEIIADSKRMLSMEVVEVNPILDQFNRTAELAVELILSATGKKIL